MKTRITWEYKTIRIQDIYKLDRLGNNGWEIHATSFDPQTNSPTHYLKRPTVNYKTYNRIWEKEAWNENND